MYYLLYLFVYRRNILLSVKNKLSNETKKNHSLVFSYLDESRLKFKKII